MKINIKRCSKSREVSQVMSAKRHEDQTVDQKPVKLKSVFGSCTRFACSAVFTVLILLVLSVGLLFIRLKTGPLVIPQAQDMAARLVRDAVSDFEVRFGEVALVAGEKGINILVQLSDVQVYTKKGQKIAEFPEVRAKLDPIQSMQNGIEVETIEIIGAEFRFLRDLNGKFNILPPGNDDTKFISPEMIFAAANITARKSPLRSLRLIDMIDTNLVYIDQVKKRIWTTPKAQLQSTRVGDVITADANIIMGSKGSVDMSVGIHFAYGLDEDFFDFGIKFDHASTVDLADQVQALDWLRNFDAAVTGSINADVKVNGVLDRLSGVLESDEGQLRDSPDAEPIKFGNIKTYFEYAKETDSLNFTEITANSAVGSIKGEAAITMHRNETGIVDSMAAAVDLSDRKSVV